jgi:hypothetical protein
MFTKISNSRLAAPSGAAASIIDNILTNAKKFGSLPAELAKELSARESIISQLLVTVSDEAKIEKYFTDFLFVYKIPWSKTSELMTKALGAPVNGATVESVLDFALEHYKRKRNISQTRQIIDDGLKLQSTSRLMNIFQMLNDALQNKPSSMNAAQFNPDSMKDMFVFNRLIGLTFAKPEEDLEMLRREFITSLDELERTREVDDRYKSIFQALQSIEFNEQLTNITKFVTNFFEIQTRDPAMLAFRRVLVQLKLGVEFRRQFFSDFESDKTSTQIRDKSGDPGQDQVIKDIADAIKRQSFKNNQYNFVRIAQTQGKTEAEIKANTSKFLQDIFNKLEVARVGLESVINNPNDPATKNVPQELKNIFPAALKIVTDTRNKVSALNNSVKDFSLDKINTDFNEIWNTLGSNLIVEFTKLPDKLSNITGINSEIFTNIFGALISATVVKNLLPGGDLKTAALGALSLIIADKNYNKIILSEIVGKPVPKSEFSLDTKGLAEAFRELSANQEMLNDLIAFDAYAKSVRATIQDRENTLVSKMTTQVKTNSSSQIDAPLAANKDIQQEYARFYQYLIVVNNNLNYYMDLIDALIRQTRSLPENDKKLLQNTGPVLENRAKIEALITDVRSKLAKYKSYALTVGNVQKRNRLIMDLGVIIPEIEKYMATGISIADLFLSPGGLSSKMKEMSDSLVEDRNKLFAEMEKVKKIQKVPVRFRTGPKPPTKPNTPKFLGTNEQESMAPTFSTFEDRPK